MGESGADFLGSVAMGHVATGGLAFLGGIWLTGTWILPRLLLQSSSGRCVRGWNKKIMLVTLILWSISLMLGIVLFVAVNTTFLWNIPAMSSD